MQFSHAQIQRARTMHRCETADAKVTAQLTGTRRQAPGQVVLPGVQA